MSAPPPENTTFINGPPMENRNSTENTPFMSGPYEPPPPYQSVADAQPQTSYPPPPPLQSNYPYPPQNYPPPPPPQNYPPPPPPQNYPLPLPPQNYPPPQIYPPPPITSAGLNSSHSYQTNNMPHVTQPVHQQPFKGNVVQETIVIQHQPNLHLSNTVNYSEHPIPILCRHCNNSVTTSIEYTSGVFTWMLCLLLLLVGCWPCCCVPFCLDSCQDVVHRCHTCQKVVGVYKRC